MALSFAHPWVLALLLLAPLVAWRLLTARRLAYRHALVNDFRVLPRGRARRARWGRALLEAAACATLVVAAAGPRTPDLRTPIIVEGVAVILALDVSGSMATPDFVPQAGAAPVPRIDAAKATLALFVAGGESADGIRFPGRPSDRLGLVTFASVPATVCPLTFNHSVLLEVLRGQKPAGALNAETNIGDAIGEACIRLETAGPGRRKALVLLSDGEHNKLGEGVLSPLTAAALAEKLQIAVHTIDCGGDPPAEDSPEARQRADGRAVLAEVARTTGGESFVANDGAQLREAFRAIDRLEPLPAEGTLYRRYHEHGGWCALAAVGLFGLSGTMGLTRWRRQP